MSKFWIILSHTYFSRLKSKAFIISTVIALLFIAGVANIQTIIEFFTSSDEKEQVIVIDESELFITPLEMVVNEVADDIQLIPYKENVETGIAAIQEEEYNALLLIEADENNFPIATYYENNAAQSSLERVIEQQLQQVKIAIATEQAGVDQATLATIYEQMPFEKIALDEATKTEEELNQARGIVYIMLFVLYMAVIIYGQMIATDVATEKSSRVMEVLISSAPPITHMFAKMIGIALLGLTQMLLFFIVGASLITSKANTAAGEIFEMFGFTSASISIYLYALLFFILGYFLYATIAAMLGSLVSRVEDVNQLLMPMMFLIIIAFIIAMSGLAVPDAKFITITSFIPFFTPMIMFLRVGMLDIPMWEIILSIGILVGTIIILAILGARIYRGGVLMYGPSRSLKDFKKAFMLTKKEK